MSLNRILLATVVVVAASAANAQTTSIRYGAEVPREVQGIYARGLDFLVKTQKIDGSWDLADSMGSSNRLTNGLTGLCVMALLANGEDPNYGQYAGSVRRAIRSIIISQDPKTGYIPSSMYHHGFAMLALAEAYGHVNEELLWKSQPKTDKQRSIGQTLELAVRCAVTGQHPNLGGWRYSPGEDSDTSVSGAVLMGLLGAQNAGIEVPNTCIAKALKYFRDSTDDAGTVQYSGGHHSLGSENRSAIATLVFAVSKKKDWEEYQATLKYSVAYQFPDRMQYPDYFRYYMAQALFQGDYSAWCQWNRRIIDELMTLQQSDGSFYPERFGPAYATSMSLLALALNYRFLPIYER